MTRVNCWVSRGHAVAVGVGMLLAWGAFGCAEPVADSISSAVVGGIPDPHPDTVGQSHVRVRGGSGQVCAGTLIAPDWVLTAGHCVTGTRVGHRDRGSFVSVRNADGTICNDEACRVGANGCYIFPRRARTDDGTIEGSMDCRWVDDPGGPNDIALLHLERPFRGLPTRSLAPLRGCGAEAEFVGAFRGEGSSGDPTSASPRTYLTGAVRSVGAGLYVTANDLADDARTAFQEGDSGGGLTRRDGDESSPLIGVAWGIGRFSDPVEGRFAAVWNPENLAWIWSILDPDGQCRLGGPGCTWREPEPESGTVCGDRHCTGSEDQASCPVDCEPQLPDSDGDGIPDARDFCPTLDARSLDPSRIREGNHVDEDGDRWGDDCVPDACALACSPDSDADGIPSCVDNCPDVANADQADCDGNGVGDACEPDVDGDGAADPCDNCPDVSNPDQANCNVDAELVAGLATLADGRILGGRGDACDAVPCGETRLGVQTTVQGGPFGGTSRVIATRTVEVDGRSTETQRARTGFRFCRCGLAATDDVETRRQCLVADLDLGGGCGVNATEEYDLGLTPDQTDRELRWRFTAIRDPSSSVRSPNAELETEYAYDPTTPAFAPSLVATWDLEADARRWASTFGDVAPAEGIAPWQVEGVLWTHTPGPVGTGMFERSVRSLAHHYWSGVVSRAEAPRPAPGCFRYVGPLLPSRGCPLCAPSFPAPFLGVPLRESLCGPALSRPSLLFPGAAVDLGDLLPVDPRDPARSEWTDLAARNDVRWVAAAEPVIVDARAASTPVGGLRVVAVDASGHAVARLRDDAFGLELEGPPCWDGECHPTVGPAPDTSEATLVLSATRRTLFAIRGESTSGRGTLRATRLLPDGRSEDLGTEALPVGRVLAVTYEPNEDVLYVLDEVDEAPTFSRRRVVARRARISKVSLGASPEVEVLMESPRHEVVTRFAMAPTSDGSLWLIASGRREHTVVRFGAKGDVRLTVRPNALATSPVSVDERGLSYVTEDSLGHQESQGARATDLRLARSGDLASCF